MFILNPFEVYRDSHLYDEYDQYICSDCRIDNENPKTKSNEPYFLESRVLERQFLEEVNPSVAFRHLFDESLLSSGSTLFKNIMEHITANSAQMKIEIEELRKKVQASQEKSKFIFESAKLHTLTGLTDTDLDEMKPYAERIKRSFSQHLTVKEVLTIAFVFFR